ncbi:MULTISPECIES: SDR family NAD(P)-dependent oxidoreductase [unclassified Streptomyces]|uniref:SDR family NAD(P)-dependent oxidoreductase n=1 Tax=unclassified Streptomyces TaxID=2593676 RepID=UPI00278C0ABB|nr:MULTISPECIES: SDR family NAD(P)-dependent oxidoreductase [unclassified Streptomyces]
MDAENADTAQAVAGNDPAEVFRGKSVVITGASNGIGSGFARHAAALGMRVVLADIAEEPLRALTEELRAGGAQAEAVRTDVSDAEAVAALADRADEVFGGTDMLINNAGIMAMGYSWEIPLDRWEAMLRINTGGVVNGLHAFVPRMLERGSRAWILNLSSVGGFAAAPLMAPYSATKFANLALTESLHLEMRMRGAPIQVSVVTPGSVKSEIFTTARDTDANVAPEVATMNSQLQRLADEHGITPEEHARRVFEQVAQGRFWVVPQPDQLDPMLRPRTEMILSRTDPQLQGGF